MPVHCNAFSIDRVTCYDHFKQMCNYLNKTRIWQCKNNVDKHTEEQDSFFF